MNPYVRRWLEWRSPRSDGTDNSHRSCSSVGFVSSSDLVRRGEELWTGPGEIELDALLGRSTIVGDIWIVRDRGFLDLHGALLTQELPIFYFEELPRLGVIGLQELREIVAAKLAIPGSRIVQ